MQAVAQRLPLRRLSRAMRVHKLPQVSLLAVQCSALSSLLYSPNYRLPLSSAQSVSCSRLKCPDGLGEKPLWRGEDEKPRQHILIEKAAVLVFSTYAISTIVTTFLLGHC